MNKKIQVVIPFWLDDYLNNYSDVYEINISEFVRLNICMSIINFTEGLFPEFKADLDAKELHQRLRDKRAQDWEREELLKTFSKIYFEARKAAEYRMGQEKKQKPRGG